MLEILNHIQLPKISDTEEHRLEIFANLNDSVHVIYLQPYIKSNLCHYLYDIKLMTVDFMDSTNALNDIENISIFVDNVLLKTFYTYTKSYKFNYSTINELEMYYPILVTCLSSNSKICLKIQFKQKCCQKYDVLYKTALSDDWYAIYQLHKNDVKLVHSDYSSFIYYAKNIIC